MGHTPPPGPTCVLHDRRHVAWAGDPKRTCWATRATAEAWARRWLPTRWRLQQCTHLPPPSTA